MSTAKKRGLGRGLGSLIPTQDPSTSDGAPEPTETMPTKSKAAAKPAPASRPSDMFFDGTAEGSAASAKAKRGDAWDSAISSGRLGLGREAAGAPEKASSDDVSRETELVPVPGATFAEIPLELISPNPKQPRTVFDETDLEELTASIDQIGVLQPVVVRPSPTSKGRYELIMGERRFRASERSGQSTIPAIVRETDDVDLLRDALLENLHRAQLNPLEEASAYRQMIDDFGCTQEELAKRIARSRPQISNTLRLLNLPPLVQRRVAAGVLSAGHARALLGLKDAAAMERLAQRIVAEGLSVRSTEEIVALADSDKPSTRRAPRAQTSSPAVTDLAGRLSDLYDTRVKVQVGRSKGRLVVEFASVEDLNRILTVMAPKDPGLPG